MYAIVTIAGKQWNLSPNQVIEVPLLAAEAGDTIRFDQVHLLADAGKVTLGNPFVGKAIVTAKVLEHGRGPKIIVGKFNSDNDPDIAVSLSASGQVLVFFGAAGMTFTPGVQNPIGLSGSSSSFGLASADFNGDTHNDLAVADITGTSGTKHRISGGSMTCRLTAR